MFQTPENIYKRPRFNRNDDYHEDLNDLFNKKFQFRFDSEWNLPHMDTWYSAPPWKVKQLDILKNRLNFHKSQLNDFNIEEWSCHTRRRNPAGEVCWKIRCLINPEFLTQAWTKFYECAYTYNIIPKEAVADRRMVSLHLCEAPGAFITSLNHYLKLNHPEISWKWVANTLNPYYEGNSPSNMISDDRFMFHTLENWDFGTDNTGNLMDWDNSQALIKKATSLGKVMLVTADGSIDCLEKPDAQEEITSPLHYCEIITALQALYPGGTFVFKLFTLFEHSTVCLLYLINHLFEEVNIYKPVTSRQGNSEVYAVCLRYKGLSSLENVLPLLRTVYGSEMYGSTAIFPVEVIPESFIKQIEECAYYFCSIQCQVINKNLQAYLMQNIPDFNHEVKKIRSVVATEFLWQYDLKPLDTDQEILKGILHEENKLNLNPRYHRGSYTERQSYDKLTLREKLDYLNRFLQTEVLSNPIMLINESVRWVQLYDESEEIRLVFTHGKRLQRINSSKFIFAPIFKLNQQIMAEKEYRDIIFAKEKQIYDNFKYEVDESCCFPEYQLTEDYGAYEKRCFKLFLCKLKGLSVGKSILVQNFNALSHFNVSVLYIIAKQCFNMIGFTSSNSIIFKDLKVKAALKYLDIVQFECDKVESHRDVLNFLNVQITNEGDFYKNIVFYNNTFYRNKCFEYLSRIEKVL
ncbi:hypothetical protein K1T71_002952 [Dendrolimus kikuchii]|uniref:Uncharacterized protein n=1 Tax=Dendrolimus kikuchii TaxID=765133 RepID=A0ACC1DB99_9NEOP|nr:hypothetical protein K1T71_002952 [Dendrolimus kikuchii]